MLGCGDTPGKLDRGYVFFLLCFKNVTWFKALCAGGGNVTFLGIISGCSLTRPSTTSG